MYSLHDGKIARYHYSFLNFERRISRRSHAGAAAEPTAFRRETCVLDVRFQFSFSFLSPYGYLSYGRALATVDRLATTADLSPSSRYGRNIVRWRQKAVQFFFCSIFLNFFFSYFSLPPASPERDPYVCPRKRRKVFARVKPSTRVIIAATCAYSVIYDNAGFYDVSPCFRCEFSSRTLNAPPKWPAY